MNALVKIFIMLALITNTAHSGPFSYGASQAGCNALWMTCVAAVGGVAAATTGGAAVAVALGAGNAGYAICMAGCIPPGLSLMIP